MLSYLLPFKILEKYEEKEGNNIYTCKGGIHKCEILRNIEYKIIYLLMGIFRLNPSYIFSFPTK